jgi:Family of unknown function (DUF6526)
MSTHQPQSLESHGRSDSLFLTVVVIAVLNFVLAIISLFNGAGGFSGLWGVVFSAALIVLALRLRQYPLKVQDRVIRLEERLRLQALAPADWHPQIPRLTEDQLIGLRFASDGEVVALARQALEENLSRRQIKERIRHWRPDNWRV